MKRLFVLISFLALPAAVGAEEELLPAVLSAPAQDPEHGTPPSDTSPGIMEYIYRNSRLEAGVLYTVFDPDLDIETDLGFYARFDVTMPVDISVNLTFRYNDFGNSDFDGPEDESVKLFGVLGGVGYHLPLTKEFTFEANAAAGLMRWESDVSGVSDDTGLIFSGEAAMSVKLHEALRFKVGGVLDVVSTEFHQSSVKGMSNLSLLVGIELGF